MNKHVLNWFWAGGVGYDADYQAWLTQIIADGGVEPTASVKTAQNALVVSLKAASLWTRCKRLWFLHAGDKTTCRRNVKSVSTYRMSEVNTVQFLEGSGCRSDGSASCWNTTVPANDYAGIGTDLTSVVYVADASNPSSSGDVYGCRSNTDFTLYRLTPKSAASNFTLTRFEGSGGAGTNATMKGLYVETYDGTNRVLYKDGTKTSAAATVTAPNIAAPILLLARNSNGGSGVTPTGYFPYYASYYAQFDRFNDSDESTLRGILDTYRTSASLP